MYPYFLTKSQALAAHAKVSEHPNILNLIATYEGEAFVYILCEFCHGTRLFSTAEVQDGYAESRSSKHFSCCLQYSFATSKVDCFSISDVSLTRSHAADHQGLGCWGLPLQHQW